MDLTSPLELIAGAAATFGAGWTSCVVYLVNPTRARLDKAEAKIERLYEERDEELKQLRRELRERLSP